MDVNDIHFKKTLHHVIDEFLISVEKHIAQKQVDAGKVYNEIAKRSIEIARQIKSVVAHFHIAYKSKDGIVSECNVQDKVEDLLYSLFQQDFLECALNAQDESHALIPEGDVHNLLFMRAVQDANAFAQVSVEMGKAFNLSSAFQLPSNISSGMEFNHHLPSYIGFECLLSSPQFESSRAQFEGELPKLRRILENGFSLSDLDMCNAASILKFRDLEREENNNFSKSIHSDTCGNYIQPPVKEDNEADMFLDIMNFEQLETPVLSWESCLKQSLTEHLYTTELMPDEVVMNSTDKDFQTYYSLFSSSGAVSDKDMVHHILDLLLGIPSRTFLFDNIKNKFQLKSGTHLFNLSEESTSRLVSEFIEYGTIFHIVQKFSLESFHTDKGLIFKGLQLGIQQILSLYVEYIAAVKMKNPDLHFLRSDVLENARLLNTLGEICGISSEKYVVAEIPKGLGLLSYLHEAAWSHKNKENKILIAVLLKYAYSPYFKFLNTWMSEGLCYDPYDEFQIVENYRYLDQRDELFWKFAYTEVEEDPMRAVPPEIKKYSHGILGCGKSIQLLKICCPNLFSLKFIAYNPPPSLSLVFSFPAAIQKTKESINYMQYKEDAERLHENITSELSSDGFYVECQQLVNKKHVFHHVLKRWNILYASDRMKTNILSWKQVHPFKHEKLGVNLNSLKKASSLQNLIESSKDCGFSGILHNSLGLLFSSCGYTLNEFCPDTSQIRGELYSDNVNFQAAIFRRPPYLLSSNRGIPSDIPELYKLWPENSYSFEMMKLFNADRPKHSVEAQWTLTERYSGKYGNCNFLNIKEMEKPCNVSEKRQKVTNSKENFGGTIICHSTQETEKKYEKGNYALGSYVLRLTSLLLSDYGDTIEDVISCIQVTSLHRLLFHNFNAIMNTRIHLVEKIIMKYMVKELGLDSLLQNLRNLYFFQDEGFSQSLCEQLFTLVVTSATPDEFANWAVLNEILVNAISESTSENTAHLSSVNVNFEFLPEDQTLNCLEFLHLFTIEFEVEWPLNIIVHQACIKQYMNIFSMVLEMEFLCWLLGRAWRVLFTDGKSLHLGNSPQYRQIMLNRFDMDQFIRVIRNCIHQHLQGPLWEFMEKSLSANELSIDALENVHLQYLERALARCFLTEETSTLYKLVTVMFNQVYKFCSSALSSSWEINPETRQFELSEFEHMSSAFSTYKQYQKVFLKFWLQNSVTCNRRAEGDFNKEVWTTLGQRVS